MRIYVANPRGFCAGVERAIATVERALEEFGPPVYVRHQVVHNKTVVEDLRARGAVFVEDLADVPRGACVVFSAHGVARAVAEEARERGLTVFDATCPLVSKVHNEVIRWRREGYECLLIGHAGHPEVEGTLGQVRDGVYLVETERDLDTVSVKDPQRVAYVTQTTLSVDDTSRLIGALRDRFPSACGPRTDDICYATQNRQDAVRAIARHCDVVVVVGSAHSSNANRLRELAVDLGVPAYLVDGAADLKPAWFAHRGAIGVTAGASTPEHAVQAVIRRLGEWGARLVQEEKGPVETVVFSLPRALKRACDARQS
ncbi:4-hydroxy-3-methylbut-2-enyl diphosphate reductase [Acidiferrobacter sp.]|uniref:4-hydroxy-3-methylbut-2-enyl diphosphate reductase n=1 Tax=Acidiferrobacter sp. TaxID=1872107 RepID=UPI00262683F1|nr:4-hydroxy-3-methylbut-2-enyl diphosphate reductase [Acidiferrobacter sp.]